MSFTYQPRCKICASPIRNLIEERVVAGEKVSKILGWTKNEGFGFSAPSIYRHIDRHFDYRNDVIAIQNKKSKSLVIKKAQKEIATKEVLQTFMQEALKNVKEGKSAVDARIGLESAKELNKMKFVYESDNTGIYYLQQLIQINTKNPAESAEREIVGEVK